MSCAARARALVPAHSCQRADNVLFLPAVTSQPFSHPSASATAPRRHRSPSPPLPDAAAPRRRRFHAPPLPVVATPRRRQGLPPSPSPPLPVAALPGPRRRRPPSPPRSAAPPVIATPRRRQGPPPSPGQSPPLSLRVAAKVRRPGSAWPIPHPMAHLPHRLVPCPLSACRAAENDPSIPQASGRRKGSSTSSGHRGGPG